MPFLHWLTKEEDKKAVAKVPYRLLEQVPELGGGDQTSGNILVQGDNLEALKALLPFYAGKVKCIYIDPPYNTQSAFAHYEDSLEHTKWISMIWPRLELLREFLSPDGLIWASVDDNEAHYMKVIMDEVFGRSNFLTNFVWQKSYGGGAKAKWFVGLHEHILCFARSLDNLPELWLPPDPEAATKYYKYRDSKYHLRGPYRLQPLATTSMDERPNLRYPITAPDGTPVFPEKQWQWSRERAEAALRNDELVFTNKNGEYVVSYKQYLQTPDGEERGRKPKSIIVGHYTQHGTAESVELFGQSRKFSFPKPEGLIQFALECCTKPGDLVLDSFLGSGTTAAVAHKMGRRYIGIEMGEHAVTHCAPRLRKVVEGEQGGISEAVGWKGGGGFRFYRLGPPVFDADGRITRDIKFPVMAAHVWFSETNSPWPGTEGSPVLGVHDGRVIALLYNGILGDKRPEGGNVLTRTTLAHIRQDAGRLFPDLPADAPLTVYGEQSRLSAPTLERERITFRQTPYDVKARR